MPFTYYRPVDMANLDRISALESASYPEDEKASYENLKFRIENASSVFLVAMQATAAEEGDAASISNESIIGYVCGTYTSASTLTHHSMETHEPEGAVLCIHSVCVEQSLRRQGLALNLLKAYLPWVQSAAPQLDQARLIAKEYLLSLYEKAGFTLVGPSEVVHGADPWFEMKYDLKSEE
eukprot:gene13717-19612_t